ncbi:MAG TPA: ferrochelatase [Acidobacteriota bacterium]|nr:ferrochelatase [Acidobacteriota bacterium]
MQRPYDALLVVSFGGPEAMEDVMPFLENVLRGKNVPRQRMLEVAEHYKMFNGVSPINDQNRDLIEAVKKEFQAHDIGLPIYWGNRNWHPLLPDALRQMAEDGIRNSLAFFTSAYSSYSGCRQYRENIEEARRQVGDQAPAVDKMRVFFNHPGFIEANADHVRQAMGRLSGKGRDSVLLFTAHSIPTAMAENCRYEAQLKEASRLVAEAVGHEDHRLVYQSRSGPPQQPWLEPDICDALDEVRARGARQVVVSPIGFTSDHLEVVYDLDHEAAQHCQELGIEMSRAPSAGLHPAFVAMVRELVQERIEGREPRALGPLGLSPHQCRPNCCLYQPRRHGVGQRAAGG